MDTASKLLEVSLLPGVGPSAVMQGWSTASKLLEVSLLPVRDWHISGQARMETASKLLEVSLLPVRVGTSAVKLGWRLPPSY
jgi:hypothetical protein